MQIRLFQNSDADKLASLFFSTIHEVNRAHYTPEQLKAWAPDLDQWDMNEWEESFKNKFVVVAEDKAELAGFAELENNGHIDRFYIAKNHIGAGLGKLLYERLEKEAVRLFLEELFLEASLTAQPFFEKMGFSTEKRQTVKRLNVSLDNFVMRKKLITIE